MKRLKSLASKRLGLSILGIVIISILLILVIKSKNGDDQEVIKVERGSVRESVEVTGTAKSIKSVDLAFEKGGKVNKVLVSVGDKVSADQPLILLDSEELNAQLLEAEANVEVQQAKLDELKVGTRLEDIKVKETELAKEKQELINEYFDVPDTLNAAYAQADDAVRKQTDLLFSNDEELNPNLTFSVSNSQIEINVELKRFKASFTLNKWKKELGDLERNYSDTALDQSLNAAQGYLEELRSFINTTIDALTIAVGISQSTADTYRTNLNTARDNLNAGLSSVNTKKQLIASQKLTIQKIEDELSLKKAGATKEQIAAQEAQVKQTEAKKALIRFQINKNTLYAPFDGVITKQEIKVGEIVSPDVSFLTIMSENKFEIEADVPEINVGKLAIGNEATVTLDAFPGEQFLGRLFYIEPAETIIGGVVNFKIKVALDQPDQRLKNGLTANLKIETANKTGVLILPIYAVQERGGSFYVEKLVDDESRETQVTLGIRSQSGDVEIISGLSEGDRVVVALTKK